MALTHFLSGSLSLLFLHHLLLFSTFRPVSGVGINYGTLGNNLPSPKKVAQLLQFTPLVKVKIYETNPGILEPFSNTAIDLIIVAGENRVVSILLLNFFCLFSRLDRSH
ncbi:hypothetical protein SLEP1_g51601 [Rubroshorea leprosula]|uniref:glucan endo-1,3-beta-D-glucosidase n=1 Tax=Rubroshorea leprosula TaxID=152421 RepID=A0AAV5M4G4_9ROSI|nr:hypothetical protein SLEP1_g51601 [Rubroshorea leprosula]